MENTNALTVFSEIKDNTILIYCHVNVTALFIFFWSVRPIRASLLITLCVSLGEPATNAKKEAMN